MDKIRAVNPNIIVRGNVDNPYYLIGYYDLSDNEWHIGYGSYCLANVKEWLKTCFEVTNADIALVCHGRWTITEILCGIGKKRKYYRCSECYKTNVIRSNFCPNCGAKMDGGDENE